jgi:DNA-binding IclR family transcriptional regulator
MRTMGTTSKYHVPNLERALRIFELLAKNPKGLNTSEIATQLKIPRNSIFRITATLHDFGYLLRDEDTKSFQLSQKFLVLGYTALTEESLVEKALDHMRHLRDMFGETVPLGILHGHEGLVIEEVPGIHSFRFVLEPGRNFHLHTAAPGKAMMAFLPPEEQQNIFKKIKFRIFNQRTIKNTTALRQVLAEVQQKGYAIDHAEEIEGMHCIAAPVFNRHGYPIAAIWITGPSIRLPASEFENIGIQVKKHADSISKSLGYGLLKSKRVLRSRSRKQELEYRD